MDRKLLARRIAEESIVLLKNEDHMLPLKEKKEIAFFGRTQIGTLYSGNGSGGANVAGCGTILEECENCGIRMRVDSRHIVFRRIFQNSDRKRAGCGNAFTFYKRKCKTCRC